MKLQKEGNLGQWLSLLSNLREGNYNFFLFILLFGVDVSMIFTSKAL